MLRGHHRKLAEVRRFDQLIGYLRDELGWPIDGNDFEDLTFEYTPEELGIDAKNAAKIEEIKRLRPLAASQPWGIFFVKFEPKRLPVVALRRILSRVALKKRSSANAVERQAWAADDLLFISNYGEGDARQISFAHFSTPADSRDLPTLKVLGWDNLDTPLHLEGVAATLSRHLKWPDDDSDAETWRQRWRSNFSLRHREVITTSRNLSIRLAELARDIRARIGAALAIESEVGPLTKLMKAFREALVHDLDSDGFADMYAQTIAYGLLSARISDPHKRTVDDFAGHMRTNPFLRELMETFLKVGGRQGKAGGPGIDFDELGVSEVVELLDVANMEAVIRDFGDRNPQEDPVIHFYEHFLAVYDKAQKIRRGVFYTPLPVVSYIVRTVDELLRTEFGLADGLADTTSWEEMAGRHHNLEVPDGVPPTQDFVQILDPATGTGTFLVEVIDIIYKTLTAKWKAQGYGAEKVAALWNEYVPHHLLPRLHGYELLMAPYAIAHLKVGLKLYETGYRFESDERARVYLTNALEPHHDFSGQFEFAVPALAHEARQVNHVKSRHQFTVVVGNPPYAQYSMNLEGFAKAHIDKFRFANGRRIRARNALQLERNLNDDYVKFLGFAADRLPYGAGVVGFITNRMFLESESLVGLREWFAKNFERTVSIDLHGSNEESRRVAQLAHDENVFEILQGVAISFYIGRRAAPADASPARFCELIGERQSKYNALAQSLRTTDECWADVQPTAPTWRIYRPLGDNGNMTATVSLEEIFPSYSTLVASNRDHLVVGFDREEVISNVQKVREFEGSNEELCEHFGITLKSNWNLTEARRKLSELSEIGEHVKVIEYRPFDRRWIFFHPTLVWQTAPVCSQSALGGGNLILIALGKNRAETINGQWITATLADKSVVSTRDNASGFPLYLTEAGGTAGLYAGSNTRRKLNINRSFLARLATAVGALQEKEGQLPEGMQPEQIVHFIYALMQSPGYRSYYANELTNGFPPIPFPSSRALFDELARIGGNLVGLHVLEGSDAPPSEVAYVGNGEAKVGRVGWSDGTVWLNARKTNSRDGNRATASGTIGFSNVPEDVWDFHIGSYQVCHKWLKDRKDRTLSEEDVVHYQKIVVALSETIRLMQEIDEVVERHGGWPGAFWGEDSGASK